ncbi:peptide/nitrate transporter [Medicago truncatula]|uniref:Peptide/nitrate transporter n=1 Tax=Medicago truncatula TaxID=3880 RepID=G7JFU2_MEDTR|nr:peptide/nitrate transporter [Medicago truncatula]
MARKVFELDKHEEESINPCTRDGSIDYYGKPAIKARTGGWKSASLLLVNQLLVALAFTGVEVNLVLFAKLVLRQSNAESANTFSRWMGTTYFFSLIGAFISDSYLGRYLTCIIFQVVFNIGLVILSLSTHFLLLKPKGCGKIGFLCDPHSPLHVAILYISIYLIALGNGAADPALATFGSDQFDEEEPKEEKSKTLFFSYFLCGIESRIIGSRNSTGLHRDYRKLGAWILDMCRLRRFFISHFYDWNSQISADEDVSKPYLEKIKFQVPANGEGLYDVQEGSDPSVRRMHHTKGLRFLDRAAIISTKEKNQLLEKAEKSKSLETLHCDTIWLCTIFSSVVFIQMLSLFVEQGSTMNRKFYKFEIPPASMTAFDIISTSAFIMLFDILIVPLYVKVIKRDPKLPSELQRIGIGLSITILALIVAGLVERKRLEFASKDGKETSSLSIFWQIPQYVLVGVAEAFVYVAQMNFFTAQAPDGLKSLGMGLSMSSSAVGSYVANTILTVVMKITSTHGRPGWVSPNLNDGHLDWFFFLSACLTGINLIFYIVCARRYKLIELEKREEAKEEEVVN